MRVFIFTLVSLFIFTLSYQPLTAGGTIDAFPDKVFTDIEGNDHSLRGYLAEGKVVIMAFWVASDPTCIAKLPALEEIYQKHGPNGTNTTIILGIESVAETVDATVLAIKNNGQASYPLINTVAGCSDKPNCGAPHYYVVCPDDGGYWNSVDQSKNGDQLVNHLEKLIEGCATYEYDAAVLNFGDFDNVICDGKVTPTFTLYNRGETSLNNVDLEVTLDGEVVYTEAWTGNLDQYATEVITLNSFDAPTETGVYDMVVRTVNPNGKEDQNTINDSKKSSLVVIAPELRDELALYVSPDFYPEEVEWELKNEDGVVLGHGEDYSGDFLEFICVERGACYEFIIYDSNADGFESGFGNLYQNGCEIFEFTSDDHNGIYTSFEFCLSEEQKDCDEVPDEPKEEEEPTTTDINDYVLNNGINMYPNPVNNGILNINIDKSLTGQNDVMNIHISNIDGKNYGIFELKTTGNTSLNVQHLPQGVYFVNINSEAWTYQQKIVIAH